MKVVDVSPFTWQLNASHPTDGFRGLYVAYEEFGISNECADQLKPLRARTWVLFQTVYGKIGGLIWIIEGVTNIAHHPAMGRLQLDR